ncbi:GNAT family N-acetyltransferase [Nocardiopsis kunsanensis]|uniref:Acetyltransferase n=1 Tax=Nocardiopsis kunsanensis TaxID=141693 RepID=A0A918XDB8_9ACTN|nr:GNAT family N-acetyltransferase [Nocardiopsis kunsanensis]GHD26799.1 acetyltransferase [Nocardiopsis kunsanensis]
MHEWARRVAADWPALEAVERGGWRLGRSDGVTKRANCALVLEPGADVDVVTDFYRGCLLTPCVQVWPGEEETDARLERAGYRMVEPTLVLGRGLAERPAGPGTTGIGTRPAAQWSALTAGSEHQVRGIERVLGRVAAGYGVAPDGEGRGCVVVDGESAAICAMVTAAGSRGRGVGRGVLEDLLAWAHDRGARSAYLCVVEGNGPAIGLYEGFGFVPVSRYHNRVLG